MRRFGLGFVLVTPVLLLGGCQSCTAAGGVDGILLTAFGPRLDGPHTLRLELDGDKGKDRQSAEFQCDFQAPENPGPELPEAYIRCDLVDVSKGIEKLADFESGTVARDTGEASYGVWVRDVRAESVEVTLSANDGTVLSGSEPNVEYGERYYPNGEECDDEGYRNAQVEIELELQ